MSSGEYEVIADLPWRQIEQTNRGTHREVIEAWQGPNRGYQTRHVVRTEAWLESYPSQSFVRGYAWDGGSWRVVIHALQDELVRGEFTRTQGIPRMLFTETEEDYLSSDRGLHAADLFHRVRQRTWRVVDPSFDGDLWHP